MQNITQWQLLFHYIDIDRVIGQRISKPPHYWVYVSVLSTSFGVWNGWYCLHEYLGLSFTVLVYLRLLWCWFGYCVRHKLYSTSICSCTFSDSMQFICSGIYALPAKHINNSRDLLSALRCSLRVFVCSSGGHSSQSFYFNFSYESKPPFIFRFLTIFRIMASFYSLFPI